MTDKVAIFLGLCLIALFAADHFYYHWDLHVFLGRQLIRVTEIVAIWR